MLILHTSDWHLNARLGTIKRQPDIVERLAEIARYLEEHRVDVMVMSGDLFSHYTHTRIEEIQEAIRDVNRVFKPFLLRGGSIVAISGNHDNEALFNLMRDTLDLAVPLDPQDQGPRPRGRLYLAAKPTCLLMEDAKGTRVQFALMPYPTVARYLSGEKTSFNSLDQRNRALHEEVIKKLGWIREQRSDPRLPSVLVAHAHIRGSQLTKHNLYQISEGEDVIFEPGDILTNWAYTAYGHIHMPQAMGGAEHVRYAGSIERLDLGERDDHKSVTLVEIDKKQRVGEPVPLLLNATPIYRIEITDPEREIPTLRDRYPEAERALVSYRLVYKPGEHNREAICRDIEAIFPRRYKPAEMVIDGATPAIQSYSPKIPLHDVSGMVRDYLQTHLTDSPYRDEVLKLAEELLAAQEVTP